MEGRLCHLRWVTPALGLFCGLEPSGQQGGQEALPVQRLLARILA